MSSVPTHRGVAINVRGRTDPINFEKIEQHCRVPLQPADLIQINEDGAQKGDYKLERQMAYPPIGDQLDAILKALNMLKLSGTNLPAETDAIIGKWLAVKSSIPKV